jgi:hypothetical protein
MTSATSNKDEEVQYSVVFILLVLVLVQADKRVCPRQSGAGGKKGSGTLSTYPLEQTVNKEDLEILKKCKTHGVKFVEKCRISARPVVNCDN